VEKENFAFGKINFIMIGISMLIVVLGFVMMTGAQSTDTQFDAGIFSAMRTKVAPMVCLLGFLSVIVGIMYHKKK
jgi:spore maturation protein SpmA